MTVSVQHPFDYILEPSKVNDGRVYWKCSGINGLYINWAGTQHFLITKTYLYKFDPLKPHSYAVKLGLQGYTLFFLFLLKTKIVGTRQNRLVEAVLTSTHNLCFFSRNKKNIRIFLSENFHFLVVKFSVYLNRHVFVMWNCVCAQWRLK